MQTGVQIVLPARKKTAQYIMMSSLTHFPDQMLDVQGVKCISHITLNFIFI
jgi:hypothetical protein